MKVILASQSPRREALLNLAGIDHETIASHYEEKVENVYNIEEKSIELAYGKALDIFQNTQGDRAIIGADTFVVKNGKIYGKPKDRKDAISMLREIQGTIHTIYTSIAILVEYQGQYKEFKETHKLNITVSPMSDDEIITYIDTDQPFDKAGAYAIQSGFCKFIEKVEGNYMAAIGLPIDRVYRILKENEIL